jgi:hypothetical protein
VIELGEERHSRQFPASMTLDVTMSDRNEILDIVRDDTKGSAAGYGVEILGQAQCAAHR